MTDPDGNLSAYLLDELGDADRAAFEAAMTEDPALRAEVDRLRPVVARLERLEPAVWDPPPPPPLDVRARSDEASSPGDRAGAASSGRRGAAERSPSRRARRRLFAGPLVLRPAAAALASLLLLAAGLGAGLLLGGEDGAAPDGPVRIVALGPVAPLGGSATGEARLARAGGTASVHVAGLRPSAPGAFYELWFIGADGELVSLGSFRVPASGVADVSVPLPADPGRFAALDVSVEPADGDPGHSKRSVLRAPLRAA
jgi:anti-sigma-K factor RskA